MSNKRNWCWEFEPSKHGPDWLCLLEIIPDTERDLNNLISHLLLPCYTRIAVPTEYCSLHQKICNRYLFVEERLAEAFTANLQGRSQMNIWNYNFIEIHECTIKIESGYAVKEDPYRVVETSFLIDLCNNPNIAIAQWSLCSGGMGYDYITVKEGQTSAELKRYIIA